MNDGWEDDDELDVDLDINNGVGVGELSLPGGVPPTTKELAVTDGWGEDGWDGDDLNLDTDGDDIVGQEKTAAALPPPISQYVAKRSQTEEGILCSLYEYIADFPVLVSSLNAVLEAEYNTIDHAVHLCQYYDARPQLRQYTLETELPRMEYTLILENSDVLMEKNEVYNHLLLEPDSILVRCANQSLLADILHTMTGPDLVIRSQLLATAVATSCKFSIFPDKVHCDCIINVSLPGRSGQRFDIAFLHVSVTFQPQFSNIQYKINHIQSQVDPDQKSHLEGCAAFLAAMMADEAQMLPDMEEPPTNEDAFRDAFLMHLSKTQQIVEAGTTGLSSAWKQIDSVANVSTKLDFVRKVGGGMFPSLPATDTILADGMQPHEETREYRDHPAAEFNETRRPAPIIGGFLISGLSRLAKTVAMPGEATCSPKEAQVSSRQEAKATIPAKEIPTISAMQVKAQPRKTEVTTITREIQTNLRHGDSAPLPTTDTEEIEGWHDDEIVIDDDSLTNHANEISNRPIIAVEAKSSFGQSTKVAAQFREPQQTRNSQAAIQSLSDSADMEYDEKTDIIPTRVRWVNPRLQTSVVDT